MNYFDILLAKKLRGGGGDITIKSLNVTQNGTYSEEGVAYSPVIVDVPLPENAYLLKEIEDVEIATFTDGSDLPMPKLEVAIEPQQDLHGYDAPWVGGAGKNKINLADITTPSAGFVYNQKPINVVVNTYTLSFNFTGGSGAISITLRNGETVVSTLQDQPLVNGLNTFTLPTLSNNADSISLYAGIGGTYENFMLEVGSTATAFAPYSNICPISGWDEVNVGVSGVNVWDEEWELGGISNTTGQNTTNNSTIRTKNYIPVVPNTQYYINSNKWQFVSGYDADKNFVGTVPYVSSGTGYYINVPSNVHYIRIPFSTAYGTTYNHDISINYPSTDTDYHAYAGKTYTLDLDGTRYGGKVDLVSGVLTVDRASVTVDENSNVISGSGGLPFRIDLLTGAKVSSSASALTGVKCNFLKEVTQSSSWGFDGTFSRVTTDAKIVYFKVNSEITTIQQLKTFLQSNNLQFVYELATPFTIQLTPTVVKSLRGRNNVFADTGNILDLSYLAKEE